MSDKSTYENPASPDQNNPVSIGIVLTELYKYMGRYDITFQFWGEGNNNVWVEKGGIELYHSGGNKDPLTAMNEALSYLKKVNNQKKETNPYF